MTAESPNGRPSDHADPSPAVTDNGILLVGDDAVFAECVRLLYRSPFPGLANLAVGSLLALVAWGQVSTVFLIGWLLLMVAATVVRVGLWRAYTLKAFAVVDAERWERRMMLCVAATGLVWGASGLAIGLDRLPVYLEGVIAISIGGMFAGAMFSLTASMKVFRSYVVPAAVGPIIGFLSVGTIDHVAVAGMGIVYLVVVLLWGRDAAHTIQNSIRLRLENQALIDDLATAREEADAAERLKRESFANLGHELRTPLNAIIGFAQSLEAEIWGPLGSERYTDYARSIAESGQHLYVLIQGILDLSRHDAGMLELEEEALDLAEIVKGCREMLLGSADSNGVTLAIDIPIAGLWVRGDPTKLRQIVINLVANAIRFTPAGGSVTVAGQRLDTGETEITVEDTGVGLDPEDIPRALEPFVQVSRDRTRDSGGAGLGLPLSKRLAELHGGWLELRSTPGEGTVVHVMLPASRAIEAPA